MGEDRWFYRNDQEWNAIAERLKQTACPHCKVVGTLIRHGFLYGFDDSSPPAKDRSAPAGSFAATATPVPVAGGPSASGLPTRSDASVSAPAPSGSSSKAPPRPASPPLFTPSAVLATAPGSASGNASTSPKATSAPRCRRAARRPRCAPSTGPRPTPSLISTPPFPMPTVPSPTSSMPCGPSSCESAHAMQTCSCEPVHGPVPPVARSRSRLAWVLAFDAPPSTSHPRSLPIVTAF